MVCDLIEHARKYQPLRRAQINYRITCYKGGFRQCKSCHKWLQTTQQLSLVLFNRVMKALRHDVKFCFTKVFLDLRMLAISESITSLQSGLLTQFLVAVVQWVAYWFIRRKASVRPQARHQTKIQNVFFGDFLSADFWQKLWAIKSFSNLRG